MKKVLDLEKNKNKTFNDILGSKKTKTITICYGKGKDKKFINVHIERLEL